MELAWAPCKSAQRVILLFSAPAAAVDERCPSMKAEGRHQATRAAASEHRYGSPQHSTGTAQHRHCTAQRSHSTGRSQHSAITAQRTSGLSSAEGAAHSRFKLAPAALVRRWPRNTPSGPAAVGQMPIVAGDLRAHSREGSAATAHKAGRGEHRKDGGHPRMQGTHTSNAGHPTCRAPNMQCRAPTHAMQGRPPNMQGTHTCRAPHRTRCPAAGSATLGLPCPPAAAACPPQTTLEGGGQNEVGVGRCCGIQAAGAVLRA